MAILIDYRITAEDNSSAVIYLLYQHYLRLRIIFVQDRFSLLIIDIFINSLIKTSNCNKIISINIYIYINSRRLL